jgi:hypothetical protein
MSRTHIFIALTLLGAATSAQAYPIAGLTPNQRPEGAPTITTFEKTDAWRKQFYHGVTEPYPASIVKWEKDQGAWFTPFNHPGMLGTFDIRGWHKK